MMRRDGFIALLLIFLSFPAIGHEPAPQALFVPNEGQWKGDFLYKTELANGTVFFTDSGYTCVLNQASSNDIDPHHVHGGETTFESFAYKMQWVGSSISADKVEGQKPFPFYHNYLLGKNADYHRSGVAVNASVHYEDVYPNVDVEYTSSDGNLKYNIILQPGGDISQVQMNFTGVEDFSLRENHLVIKTPVGEVTEWIPESYQMIDGVKKAVSCHYSIQNGTVGFSLGNYDPAHPVVIDPILEFSTYSGSTSSNWGFTATYDQQGGFYGGGIAFSNQYPVTTGAFQTTFSGMTDIAINKFSSDGTQLEYATYVGGSKTELPHSMVTTQQGQLYVLGNTGSADFPVSSKAFQQNYVPGTALGTQVDSIFKEGSNIFIIKLNASGTGLLAATFLGGNVGDGLNQNIAMNYGDNSRGEIIELDNGNVAIASSSLSPGLPLDSVGQNLFNGNQNALVAVFNPALTGMIWGHYFGGSGDEAGYSIKTDGTHLFLAGSTTSSDLQMGNNSAQPSFQGGQADGFLAKFRASDGQYLGGLYLGTSGLDQAFLTEVDKHGKIYVFGQSGASMPISPNCYSNSGSSQFVQQYDNNLSNLEWSTQIGSGQNKTDLVPTAFMVDHCLNIYLSGWGGSSNTGYLGGNTNNLPLTGDAFQSTSDGSDFYFMVLERNAESLLFGSYFGGSSQEHVDGGTSRFSPEGTIYQAACAGCYIGNFRTTPSAYSPSKPVDSCNFGAVKIDFEQTVRSVPQVNFGTDVDTVCDELHVDFSNKSLSANSYYWDFGNGQTSTDSEPTAIFSEYGEYTITLVAEDTICDLVDTNSITIEHTAGVRPEASFEADYVGCDKNFEVQLKSTSLRADQFMWNFGDGKSAPGANPVHHYADSGTYEIRMIAYDSKCNTSDTAFRQVRFQDTITAPDILVSHAECGKGQVDVSINDNRGRYNYYWEYDGGTPEGPSPDIKFNREGFYRIQLLVEDTLCGTEYEEEFGVSIDHISREIFIPNAFSPNGDGINESFLMTGDDCLQNNHLIIFNRWGETVFETETPFEEFWDGGDAPSGVYTYILQSGNKTEKGFLTLFR